MPAKVKVSIGWQIIFAIMSPVNLWAFYRIKKLRKYVLYVLIPSAIMVFALSFVGYYEMTLIDPSGGQLGSDAIIPLPPYMTPIKPHQSLLPVIPYNIISIGVSIGLTIFSVYLAMKWSRQWNGQFP
ncbi:MAG: hypothetical protein GKS07_10210 [Nitrosopumilus sp.]|nr:MAG: hypothetical protein GKS07_10210 [Nitrosopumilus sp.]